MEAVFLPKNDICLTCLLESSTKLQPIINAAGEDLTKTIEECGGIKIPKGAYYPNKICSSCYAYLKIAYEFRLTCQRSYEELRRRVKHEIKSEEQDCFENVILTNEESLCSTGSYAKVYERDCLDESEESFHLSHEEVYLEVQPEPQEAKIQRKYTKREKSCKQNGEEEEKSEPRKKRGRKRATKPLEVLEDNFKIVGQFNDSSVKGSTEDKKPKEKDLLMCHQCGNKYPNKQRLHAHLKQHKAQVERENECEICAKRFITARHLQIHMNTHTGNRPYKCKYCSAAFGDPSSRIKHEHAHDNIRAYKCEICDKTFTYSYALTKHQRIHTGEKPFGCSYCQKRFIQKHHQKAHELTHIKQFERELKFSA